MTKAKDSYEVLLEKIASVYVETRQDLSAVGRNKRTLNMFWEMGRYIVEMEQDGEARAAYGARLIPRISKDLSARLGDGFSESSVLYIRQYFNEYEIPHPGGELTWSHYKVLMTVKAGRDRVLLERRAIEEKLSKNALLKLAREMNGVDTGNIDPAKTRTLKPRKGQLDIVKLVEVAEGKKTRLMADCGFRVLANLPQRHSPKLKPGEYLLVQGNTRKTLHD